MKEQMMTVEELLKEQGKEFPNPSTVVACTGCGHTMLLKPTTIVEKYSDTIWCDECVDITEATKLS